MGQAPAGNVLRAHQALSLLVEPFPLATLLSYPTTGVIRTGTKVPCRAGTIGAYLPSCGRVNVDLMKLFNMATPVVMLVGLLFASVGITDGVLTADGVRLPSHLSWAQPGAHGTLSVVADHQMVEEAGPEEGAGVLGSAFASQPDPVVFNDPYVDEQWR